MHEVTPSLKVFRFLTKPSDHIVKIKLFKLSFSGSVVPQLFLLAITMLCHGIDEYIIIVIPTLYVVCFTVGISDFFEGLTLYLEGAVFLEHNMYCYMTYCLND